jgi:DNA uptake protein ComE-like DNA-binding protein
MTATSRTTTSRKLNPLFFVWFQADKEDQLDLSTASKKQLMTLPGVGPVIAGQIIDARPLTSEKIEALGRVRRVVKDDLISRL